MDIKVLTQIADDNMNSAKDGATFLEDVIKRCDIVFALWRDPNLGDGVDKIILKGEALLKAIAEGDRAKACAVSAVWVGSLEIALSAKLSFGEIP